MDLLESHAKASRHPWETTRFDFFSRTVRDAPSGASAMTVLDVGSGDAWFASRLAGQLPVGARVTCWDTGYEEAVVARLEAARDARVALVRDRPGATFDLVLMLDVLEHVEDDLGFLAAIVAENMHAGSSLLFSVPAWQSLWSRHDEHLRHVRRYSPAVARAMLERAGLRVVASGGLFHSLVLPRALSVALERLAPRRSPPDGAAWGGGPWVTSAVRTALKLDTVVSRVASSRGIELPGLSWWARCERA